MTTRLLTLRDVTGMTALSRSAVYALMAASRFPKPIRIGRRAVRWVDLLFVGCSFRIWCVSSDPQQARVHF